MLALHRPPRPAFLALHTSITMPRMRSDLFPTSVARKENPAKPSQEDVMAAFYSTSPQEDEDSITAYKARAERIVKLSSLKKIYTRKDKAAALTLLSEKRRLVIDESYLLDSWSQVWPVLLEVCVCHTSTLLSGRRLIPS